MVPGHHPRRDLTPAQGLRCGFVSETPGPARTIQPTAPGLAGTPNTCRQGACLRSPDWRSPSALVPNCFFASLLSPTFSNRQDSGRDASLPTTSTLPLTFYCTCSLRSPVAGLPALWAPAARTGTSPPGATASFTPDDGSGFVYGSLYSLERRTYRQ